MSQLLINSQLVELPDNIPGKDCAGGFVCSLHKAGSSMLISALRRTMRRAGVKHANLNQQFFLADLLLDTLLLSDQLRSAVEEWLRQPGVLFAGWRQFPVNYDLPLTSDTRTYLLVRDPRDIATSKYFSLKYSHTTQGATGAYIAEQRQELQHVEIDAFALGQARLLRQRFEEYEVLRSTRLMLRRYEDIIFDKLTLLSDLCRHFEVEARPGMLKRVAETIDQRPEKEDINAHVRQVTPGDHRRKLKPETIEQMNDILADVLAVYDYPLNVETANV